MVNSGPILMIFHVVYTRVQIGAQKKVLEWTGSHFGGVSQTFHQRVTPPQLRAVHVEEEIRLVPLILNKKF